MKISKEEDVVGRLRLQHVDEDSTSVLINDVSRLSDELIKHSSSNLQRAEHVKAIHKKTRDRVKDLSSTELPSPRGAKIHMQYSETSQFHKNYKTTAFGTKVLPSRHLDYSQQHESISSQAYDDETPSTMSEVLRQYDQTIGYGHTNTAILDLNSDDTRKQFVANGNRPKPFTPVTYRNQLPPMRESTERKIVNEGTVNTMKPGKWMRQDMLRSACMEKMDKLKESFHHFSSETSFRNNVSRPLYSEAVQASETGILNFNRENEQLKIDLSTAALSDSKNPVPNHPHLNSTKNLDHIEAWFTPSKKVSQSAEDNTNNLSNQCTVLPFTAKKRASRHAHLILTEKVAKFGRPQAPTMTAMNPHSPKERSSSRSIKNLSSVYDDEWSPIVQTDYDENTPDIRFGGDCNPSRFMQIRKNRSKQKLPLKEMKSIDYNNSSNASRCIPRNIHCKSLISFEKGKPQDKLNGDKCFYNTQTMHDRKHTLQATKRISHEPERLDEIKNIEKINAKCIDAVPNLDSNTVYGDLDESSSKSNFDVSSSVDYHEETPKIEKKDIITVAVAAHAHAKNSIASSTIDNINFGSQQGSDPFNASKSTSTSIDRQHSYGANHVSSSKFSRKEKGLYQQKNSEDIGIESEENDLSSSEERNPFSTIHSPNSDQNVSAMNDIGENIGVETTKEFVDEISISNAGTDYCSPENFSAMNDTEENIVVESTTEYVDEYSISDAGTGNCSPENVSATKDTEENIVVQSTTEYVDENSISDAGTGYCSLESKESHKQRKQRRRSSRVSKPLHPICSLQRLEELILQQKRGKSRAKRPRRGRPTKRKKKRVQVRRKSRSRNRS